MKATVTPQWAHESMRGKTDTWLSVPKNGTGQNMYNVYTQCSPWCMALGISEQSKAALWAPQQDGKRSSLSNQRIYCRRAVYTYAQIHTPASVGHTCKHSTEQALRGSRGLDGGQPSSTKSCLIFKNPGSIVGNKSPRRVSQAELWGSH